MTTLHRSTSTQHGPYTPTHPPRYHHSRSHQPVQGTSIGLPWEHMTKAYAWVSNEEDYLRGQKRSLTTEDWVREQQSLLHQHPKTAFAEIRPRTNKIRRNEWEELIYVYKVEADQWMKQEAHTRRLAEEREKTKIRIQDEVRKMEQRFEEKRKAQAREREETRRRASQERRERREKEARDRAKLDKLIQDAWANYEAGWTALTSSSGAVEFKKIPWPLIVPPRNTGDLTRDAIVAFLFSPMHSQSVSRKDRIRSAQLRWHPDRFRRFMERVVPEERSRVEEGVGIVARCLNELMEREKRRM